MARGITSFTAYRKIHTPGGTRYMCAYCSYAVMRHGGNALAQHARAVAVIKRHAETKHPETKGEW